MDVAISVGHSKASPGAVAVDGIAEWHWHHPLANALAVELAGHNLEAEVFYRPELPYSLAMHDLVQRINRAAPRVVLELHFNAFPEAPGQATVTGTMALYWPTSEMGHQLARKLSAATAQAQGTIDRGARAQALSWAGAPLYILQNTRAPSVILETHYGDAACDHQRATAARDSGATARALAAALAEVLA